MRQAAAAGQMPAAHQALKSCRLLLRENDPAGACNRAYYAMFYAAHAALKAAGVIKAGMTYKTHAGLVTTFAKKLVLTGRLPSALSKVLNMRLLADYNGDPVEDADAQWAVRQAESFVAAIESALPMLAKAQT